VVWKNWTIDDCRRFYADEIRFAAALTSAPLVEAFAHVPRERFLGHGPWTIGSMGAGLGKPARLQTGNVQHLYHNVPVALDIARGVNNGQPGALALWIDALNLTAGDRVFHLGCGVGYYPAIMAEVVGATGRVTAVEVLPDLAGRARENLLDYQNVTVHAGDGAAFDPGQCDAVFINAGVTHPHPPWLDALTEGGRMVVPLTAAAAATFGNGIVARITRAHDCFSARVVSRVAIYSCTSMRDPHLEAPLAESLETKQLLKLRSVLRAPHEPADTCLLHRHDVCLSSAEPLADESAPTA
jgi:protein-L-isoaspartate(D-aspartate) O-methyltransferase